MPDQIKLCMFSHICVYTCVMLQYKNENQDDLYILSALLIFSPICTK